MLNNTIKSYHLENGHSVKLYNHEEVWAPYSAPFLAKTLINNGYVKYFQNKNVADIGTGSGILGIWIALKKAKSVTMSDLNEKAIQIAQENTKLNNIATECKYILSESFKEFRNLKFDTIISNPPVQPWLSTGGLLTRPNAKAWNEAGKDGRLVLDELISKAKNHLEKDGVLIFDHSSRHGYKKTQEQLEKHWGEKDKNWKNIGEFVFKIDEAYHGPYLKLWFELQKKDKDKRIFNFKEIKQEFNNNTNLKYIEEEKEVELSDNLKNSYFYKYIITIASRSPLRD